MIPIKDHNPSGIFPIVTYSLLALNILIFLSYSFDEIEAANMFLQYALVPDEIMRGENYHTLISSMFLHGGFMHLAGNMAFLYIFGDNLEAKFGKLKFLGFYLASGIIASAVQIWSNPDSFIPNVGASGAIAGVMGGYLILYPKAKVDILILLGGFTRISTIPAFYMLGYWIALQVFMGIQSFGAEGGGVAYWAHAGGFIAGVIITALFLPLKNIMKNFFHCKEKGSCIT